MTEVLFCPFCRESFEGERQCPEHELDLVPVFELPVEPKEIDDDERLPWFTWQYGRAPVAFGAVLLLIACALPLARTHGAMDASSSLWTLAQTKSPRLWVVPMAACMQLAMLYRRRTLRGMRGVRLTALLLAAFPAILVATTLHGMYQALAMLETRMGVTVRAEVGLGAYLVYAASAVMAFAALRLGVHQNLGRTESGR
jgi:hypothetical protein